METAVHDCDQASGVVLDCAMRIPTCLCARRLVHRAVQGRAISSLLIANRGEIAIRIARAARDARVRSVAVFRCVTRRLVHGHPSSATRGRVGGCSPPTSASPPCRCRRASEDDATSLHTRKADRAVALARTGAAAYFDVAMLLQRRPLLDRTEGAVQAQQGFL